MKPRCHDGIFIFNSISAIYFSVKLLLHVYLLHDSLSIVKQLFLFNSGLITVGVKSQNI